MSDRTEHQHTPRCRDLLAQLSDYIDGELEATLCAELEQHLAGCHDCQILVDTTRKTVTLYRRHGEVADLPEGTLDRLRQALKQSGCEES
jgi:anti-sigma factor RsiW